jgi:glycosyltransferase involved in cell wall biosynthesis
MWTSINSTAYGFWTRYLDVFREVQIFGRAQPMSEPPSGWQLATGPGVTAFSLPDFTGPLGMVKKYFTIRARAGEAARQAEAIILRVGCPVGGLLWNRLPKGRPFAVEVIGDPYDSLAPGAVRVPFRPFFRWQLTNQLRRQCHQACAAAYVTAEALQRRYPCPNFSIGVSDVILPTSLMVSQPRTARAEKPFRLVYVGTLAQLYKAPDVLIDAVGLAVKRGCDIHLTLLGDGQYREELTRRAAELGLAQHVHFRGHVSDPAIVREELDHADLFVLPSRQEGLPRALVEAMARALPAIGSTVGGFPELLQPNEMVPPGDAAALAQKIEEVLKDPQRWEAMSRRNLEKAHDYREDILAERRRKFYTEVHDQTARWLAPRGSMVQETAQSR